MRKRKQIRKCGNCTYWHSQKKCYDNPESGLGYCHYPDFAYPVKTESEVCKKHIYKQELSCEKK